MSCLPKKLNTVRDELSETQDGATGDVPRNRGDQPEKPQLENLDDNYARVSKNWQTIIGQKFIRAIKKVISCNTCPESACAQATDVKKPGRSRAFQVRGKPR